MSNKYNFLKAYFYIFYKIENKGCRKKHTIKLMINSHCKFIFKNAYFVMLLSISVIIFLYSYK